MKTRLIVMSAWAKMPSSCMGQYRKVAVVEVEADKPRPKMISERAKGVVRIVKLWDRLNYGSTSACAYERALVSAEELIKEMKMSGKNGT